jgi:hypothetical protein
VSCDYRAGKVSSTAGVRAGINQMQGKLNNGAGAVAESFKRGAGRTATAALSVTENFKAPSLDALGTAVVLAGAMRGEKTRRQMLVVAGLGKLTREAAVVAGSGLARLSRVNQEGVTGGVSQKFFFKSNTPVTMWRSRLTPFLNSQDVAVWTRGQIKSSQGVMLESGGKSWHQGTTVLQTGQAITHLQSMAVPARHYYFNRPLSESEAVGLITGQKGFEAKNTAGFAGEISEVESLSPLWAETKRALIKAHIFWGSKG